MYFFIFFLSFLFLSTNPISGENSSRQISTISEDQYCAFCDPQVLLRQTFYEGDLVRALCTHKPIYPGHCLVIPKRHVERFEDLTAEEITEIGITIQKVDQAVKKVFHTGPYLLLQKNGKEVGQTVPHVHFHYIPRKEGDDSTIMFLVRMFGLSLLSPISAQEIEKNVTSLRSAMEDSTLLH